jgi:predicted GNAT superfamily acetyltransferase
MTSPIQIRDLTTIGEMERAEDLQRAVWPGSETDILPAHLLATLAHNGGVVLGAFEGDRLVGLVLGFLGTDSSTPDRVAMARLKHCSHMLGVLPGYEGRGIGFQLKVAQREAVIGQGVRLVTWTYDPLLSRNANLNIRRLGAVCRTYIKEAYGAMRDELNVGDASDRFQVDWWVTSARVSSRIQGKRGPLGLAHFLAAGAEEINPAILGPDDLPRPADSPGEPKGTLALVEIPSDYPALRASDPGLAQTWREQTRSIFSRAFDSGFMVTDFVHLTGGRLPRSYYVLSHGEGTFG